MTKSLIEQQLAMAGMSKDLLKSQTDMIQLKNQLPNEHQNNIDMYGQMSEATGYKQRPNEPWRALLDGMFKGMARGEKSEMSKKARENYETLEKGTAFIMDWGRAGQQMLADLNKKEKIKETISGYVNPIYSAMMAGADRQKIDDMGRPSFSSLQDQGIIPQGSVYLTIDTQSKTLIYNKADGSKGYVDLMPYVSEETMNMNKQRIEQMGMDARMMSAEASQMNAQAHMTSAETGQERLAHDKHFDPQLLQIRKSEADNAKARTNEMAGKRIQKVKEYYEPKIIATTNVISAATKLKAFTAARPDMLNSLANVLYTAKHDRSDVGEALNLFARQQVEDEQLKEYIATFDKLSAELRISQVKGLSNPNILIDGIVSQTVPGKGIPLKAYDKLISDMIDKAEQEQSIYVESLNATRNIMGEEEKLGDFYTKQTTPYIEKVKEDAQKYYGTSFSKMKTEDLGQIDISKLSIEEAKQFKDEILKRKGGR